MSCEDFEKKWGFNYNKNGKEVIPNFVLCKHNSDEIESTQIIDLDVVDRNMSCEDFEKKWGFNYNKNGKEVIPNFVLCKHNSDEIESTKTIMDGFADSQYSGG
eukprot:189479_1